jgi:hypothetical protein
MREIQDDERPYMSPKLFLLLSFAFFFLKLKSLIWTFECKENTRDATGDICGYSEGPLYIFLNKQPDRRSAEKIDI